jgi:hypothetical protein
MAMPPTHLKLLARLPIARRFLYGLHFIFELFATSDSSRTEPKYIQPAFVFFLVVDLNAILLLLRNISAPLSPNDSTNSCIYVLPR